MNKPRVRKQDDFGEAKDKQRMSLIGNARKIARCQGCTRPLPVNIPPGQSLCNPCFKEMQALRRSRGLPAQKAPGSHKPQHRSNGSAGKYLPPSMRSGSSSWGASNGNRSSTPGWDNPEPTQRQVTPKYKIDSNDDFPALGG